MSVAQERQQPKQVRRKWGPGGPASLRSLRKTQRERSREAIRAVLDVLSEPPTVAAVMRSSGASFSRTTLWRHKDLLAAAQQTWNEACTRAGLPTTKFWSSADPERGCAACAAERDRLACTIDRLTILEERLRRKDDTILEKEAVIRGLLRRLATRRTGAEAGVSG